MTRKKDIGTQHTRPTYRSPPKYECAVKISSFTNNGVMTLLNANIEKYNSHVTFRIVWE